MALDECLRPLSDPRAITAAAAEFLGRSLDVDRCAYATVEEDEDTFVILGDYLRGVKSIVGRYRFSDFGDACLRQMRAGEPWVVSDRRTDPRLGPGDQPAYEGTGIDAVICVPIHKASRFAASMAVHGATPRTWSQEEVEVVQAVANRCWESIERARVEHSLRDNEQRYRALLASAAHILWTADASGRVIKDSNSWRAFTGQTATESRDDGWLNALHPDDRKRLKREWPAAAQAKQPVDMEYRVRHRDGGWRWTSVRVVPILNADGTVREWFGMNSDITVRKLAERRDAFLVRLDDATRPLTEPPQIAQTVLRLLCEELAADRATYFEIDDDGHAGHVLADYAPRLCPLQGIYPLEEYGTDFAKAVRTGATYLLEDIAQANLTEVERKRFDAIQISAELMVPLHKAGALKATLGLFQGRPRVWQPEEIQLTHLVVQRCWDSLERARIEREVRQADRRKDEFIATLAHELRNPLAPIRNGLTILQRSDDQERRTRIEGMMERQVDHLVRMVDDLLDVSRINRGMIELHQDDVALQEALRNAVDTALPSIQASHHALSIEMPDEPVWVRGDAVRLTQVFANLLNNAAKFTLQRGRIRLVLGVDGEHAVVAVEDTGIGIPPTMLHEIFEIFAQGPGARMQGRGGLGIGLSLVRRLVALHGGHVLAHSEGPDRGSRFEVRLPLLQSAHREKAEKAAGAQGDAASGRILVVDDNHDAADSIVELLRMQGWDVAVAYDGAAALKAFERRRFDLALLDLGMPGMDGYQLARRIRELGHMQIVLVALTGWGQTRDRTLSQEAGFDHHLVKPVGLEALMQVLQSRLPARAGVGTR
ncbi:MAG TPA: ATP-binding protein [Nevskiaceae bacterium]|nr:ATP-binding protein [Nevskiaceae bacterium]